MRNKMSIRYINGLNADRVEVSIFDENKKVIFSEEYAFGYNASYNRVWAAMAEADYINSIKYNWGRVCSLKPFIGDILNELCQKYDIEKDKIVYSGKYIFTGNEYTEEEAQDLVRLFEDK